MRLLPLVTLGYIDFFEPLHQLVENCNATIFQFLRDSNVFQ